MKTLKLLLLASCFVALPFTGVASASDNDHTYHGYKYKKGFAKQYKKGYRKGYRKGYQEGLHGSSENPELALTIWIFSFNNPSGCLDTRAAAYNSSNCFVDDIFNPNAQVGALHLTGGVARPNGDITMAGTLYETAPRTPLDPAIEPGQVGLGLMDGMNTEVALIIRSHGELVTPRPDDQLIQLISPSCDIAGGDRKCEDLYWVTYPVGATESPVFDFIAELNNPTGNPEIFGCSKIYRYDGAVSVVVHTNVKHRKTKWLKETCGM